MAASGVHPKTAQELMRHSDINLTMSWYSHTLRGQTAKVIEGLPDLAKSARAEKIFKTGTDNKLVECISEKNILPDNRLTIYLAKLGTENGNQPESTGLLVPKKENLKSRNISQESGFLGGKGNERNMGALGLEPRTYALKGRCENDVSVVNKGLTGIEQADFAIYLATMLQKHPELEKILSTWGELPDHIKQTIQTLVGTVTIADNDNVDK